MVESNESRDEKRRQTVYNHCIVIIYVYISVYRIRFVDNALLTRLFFFSFYTTLKLYRSV